MVSFGTNITLFSCCCPSFRAGTPPLHPAAQPNATDPLLCPTALLLLGSSHTEKKHVKEESSNSSLQGFVSLDKHREPFLCIGQTNLSYSILENNPKVSTILAVIVYKIYLHKTASAFVSRSHAT
jgi:hypothetical protein